MKHYTDNNEAQLSAYERAQIDRHKIRVAAREIKDKFGLSFNGGKLLIFFCSEEDMLKKQARLEETHGKSLIIKPKKFKTRERKRVQKAD